MSWRFTSVFGGVVALLIGMLLIFELFSLMFCALYHKGYLVINHAETCHRSVVMILFTLPIDVLSWVTRFIASFF